MEILIRLAFARPPPPYTLPPAFRLHYILLMII